MTFFLPGGHYPEGICDFDFDFDYDCDHDCDFNVAEVAGVVRLR